MRFYLDVDLSDVIARIARQSGVDIISVHEMERKGLTDEQQLLLAAGDGRCVVTKNVRHFARLPRDFESRGLPHAGVVFVSRSLPGESFAAVSEAIVRFNAEHPDGLPPYSTWWLSADER